MADALDEDNDAYVGVSPEYKNHAYNEQKPYKGKQADIEKVVRKHEAERQKGVPVSGFTAMSQDADGDDDGDGADDNGGGSEADDDGAEGSGSEGSNDGGDVPV